MSANNIKFIATDMDGTLLNHQGQLSPEFYELFPLFAQNDIIFAAASGRQYYQLAELFAPVRDEMMFIAENGTFVMYKGEEVYSCTLDREATHNIIAEARQIDGAFIVLCGKKSAYIETRDPDAYKEIKKYYHRCEIVDDLLAVEDEFIKLAILHFGGALEYLQPPMKAKFGKDYQVVGGSPVWLDVMNMQASKGAAIEHLQQTLGFSFEQTMSFGDYFNDVEMLQASYHSYAMENAHEEVKTHARFRAPSNDENGVLTVIKSLLLPQG
uniref:Cof-type HAD-IIB family hydrolase n=1 Tax=Thaumasiovibrio occultus TaxID=1891184 RepID=UPI000B35FED1|nr:Cof-type HAD-IIB family hydrolase [Thaumasiovibrio occultus]